MQREEISKDDGDFGWLFVCRYSTGNLTLRAPRQKQGRGVQLAIALGLHFKWTSSSYGVGRMAATPSGPGPTSAARISLLILRWLAFPSWLSGSSYAVFDRTPLVFVPPQVAYLVSPCDMGRYAAGQCNIACLSGRGSLWQPAAALRTRTCSGRVCGCGRAPRRLDGCAPYHTSGARDGRFGRKGSLREQLLRAFTYVRR